MLLPGRTRRSFPREFKADEVALVLDAVPVQLAAGLGMTQESAWHLGHHISAALADGSLPGLEGPVEVDETPHGNA